jgi:hypothetical protein
VLSPHGGEGAEALGGLDVANKTDDNKRGGLDDSDGLDDFLFVDLGLRFVGLTHDVGHTGLVAQEGSEVAWLGGVILGELANAAPVVGGALAGKEPEGSVAGSFKLAV